MKNTIIVLGIIIIIGIGYYLISKPASTVPSSTVPATADTHPSSINNMAMPVAVPQSAPVVSTSTSIKTSVPQRSTVNIKNFAFNPDSISVKAGTKVTWTNNDSVAHTVTSDSGTLLESATIVPGSSFGFTFATPGTYAYHCSIHPMMHGTIIVTN